MSGCTPPPRPEDFTLGLSGFGYCNVPQNQTARTTVPASRRLNFQTTELEIALAEQKRQAAVITLLQQRLEDRDRGTYVYLLQVPTPRERVNKSTPGDTRSHNMLRRRNRQGRGAARTSIALGIFFSRHKSSDWIVPFTPRARPGPLDRPHGVTDLKPLDHRSLSVPTERTVRSPRQGWTLT